MTQPVDVLAPAIGACLSCRSLFLVTFDTPNCILCGNPPTYTLSFAPAHPEPVEGPPIEEQPAEESTDEEGIMPPPSTAPEEPPAAESVPLAQEEEAFSTVDLVTDIADYLVGEPVELEELNGHFQELGAHPEAAATAVGRLVAVRELIMQLTQPQEPQPDASPELLSALAQAPYAHPSVGSPPPSGEQDRTTVPSP